MTLFLKKIVLDDASDKIESRSFKDVRLGASVISEFCRRLRGGRLAGRGLPSSLGSLRHAAGLGRTEGVGRVCQALGV